MKGNKNNISIINIIIIMFIISTIILSLGLGHLVFSKWLSSAESTTESIVENINEGIYNDIYSFIYDSYHINENNHKIIQNGILDVSDENLRNKFFVGVLESQGDEFYSFSYGTINGEYYGARRNADGVIEIMKNNAETGGNSLYYSVNDDMTAGELVVDVGPFDPRTREWYKVAAENDAPYFSPVYKHFVMDDLTVSAAWPVYNSNQELMGVMGTHMLLSDIGIYLSDAVEDYNAYALILEKDSNNLIANSMGEANFLEQSDGGFERLTINDIDNDDLIKAYDSYNLSLNPQFIFKGEEQNLSIDIKEIEMNGLSWIIIFGLDRNFLIAPINNSILAVLLLGLAALCLSYVIYIIITKKLMRPINNLLEVSDALCSGDISRRIKVVRNDEIGKISQSFNKVADKMQYLINNLESAVQERTEQLYKSNFELEESKNKLQLILNSTAEAVYGVNMEGNCTFCNASCLKMLGYKDESDLLGKNMHIQIHHSRRDKTELPVSECKIIQTIKEGKASQADDEAFWKADGTFFDVEYHSYPQIKNGKIIGAVITFMDITDRKKRDDDFKYLSCHDILTGLYNRRCFEELHTKVNKAEKLPLSVIFADINGLKMTNDIFGHAAGDKLIKKSSEILKKSCKEKDIIARIGGDEFVILLPNMDFEKAKKVIARIRAGLKNARVEAIKCSISLGLATKLNIEESLEKIMSDAENAMYKDKTMNRSSINKDIINTIVDTLHSHNIREKEHSIEVSRICGDIGMLINLSERKINVLKSAGYLHDIGKITLPEILSKTTLTAEEVEKMKQHSVTGYRILNLFDDTVDLAEYVYSHHERWDGKGYPRGLKGEQIPLFSRIISVAETYDRVLNNGEKSEKERKQLAFDVIKKGSGKEFDPKIVEIFLKYIMER